MSLSTKCILAVCALLIGSLANAGNFTFEAHDDEATVVEGVDATGQPIRGQMVSGTSTMTVADGKKTDSTHKCSSLFNYPRNAAYPIHMICEVTNDGGAYNIIAGCKVAPDKTISCLGDVVGKSGAYAGKRGLVTIYTRGTSVSGVGQFFD